MERNLLIAQKYSTNESKSNFCKLEYNCTETIPNYKVCSLYSMGDSQYTNPLD